MEKIKVTYPDNKGNHETTFDDLRERFKEERPDWVEGFFQQIKVQGYAYTRFGAKYELVK